MRRWAYHYLLPDRPLTLDQLAPEGAVPARERWYLSYGMFALSPLMRYGKGINETAAVAAVAAMDATFSRVEAILKQQPYLSGAAFGLLDLNFAALASAIVLPPEHALYSALYHRLPEESPLKAVANQYRARPAGQLVLKCYKLHRK
jgi:glutathione S-transferase